MGVAVAGSIDAHGQQLQSSNSTPPDMPPDSRGVTDTVPDNSNLEFGAAVSGTVFSDTNGNGVQDAGEEGIAGHTMHAIDLVTGDAVSADTAGDGTYTFDNVRPAPDTTLVHAGFFPPGHTVTDAGSSWFSYVSPSRSHTETFDVGFYPVPADERVTLDLTIFLDGNRNGTRDAGEEGIGGLSFTVRTYTTGPETVTTGADGMVAKTDLVPADWAVTDLPWDYLVTAYSYGRSDPTEGKMYDSTLLLADEPEPGSVHIMVIGMVPAPGPLLDGFESAGPWEAHNAVGEYDPVSGPDYETFNEYSFTTDVQEGNPSPSAKISGDGFVSYSAIQRTFSLERIGSNDLFVGFDYRATSGTSISSVTNVQVDLLDKSGNVLYSHRPANGGTTDTGWQSFSYDATDAVSGQDSLTVRLGIRDAWIHNWHQTAHFDNFHIGTSLP